MRLRRLLFAAACSSMAVAGASCVLETSGTAVVGAGGGGFAPTTSIGGAGGDQRVTTMAMGGMGGQGGEGGGGGRPSPVGRVSGGGRHTCGVRDDGAPRCWGLGTSGQLGDGMGMTSPPVSPTALAQVYDVSCGASHTCAIAGDRKVWCWGTNPNGELGNGTTNHALAPVEASGPTNVDVLGLGAFHSCASSMTGELWCWGAGAAGELGNGGVENSATPQPVPLLDVVDVAAGFNHTCAVTLAGEVLCWGKNTHGKLGGGEVGGDDVLSPQAVPLVTDAIGVTAGSQSTCALRQNGKVSCWGANNHGQLGNGTGPCPDCPSADPVDVVDLADAVAVAAGDAHVCALRAEGTVVCWGSNASGQLGDESAEESSSSSPVKVPSLEDVVAIGAGDKHTCAVVEDGSIWCWGANDGGQLGDQGGPGPIPVNGL